MDREILREKLRLYLVCGEGETRESLLAKTAAAIAGGVTAVQLRVKSWPARDFLAAATALSQMTKRHDVLFIVNDRIDIALASDADGVHLGQSDIPIEAARRIVPPDFIVGGSAHTNRQAMEASGQGADYIGCGSVFPTGTKTDAEIIGPAGVRETLRGVGLPAVAIGGITLGNLGQLADCGCCGVSLVSEIMNADDPEKRTRELIREIDRVFAKKGNQF